MLDRIIIEAFVVLKLVGLVLPPLSRTGKQNKEIYAIRAVRSIPRAMLAAKASERDKYPESSMFFRVASVRVFSPRNTECLVCLPLLATHALMAGRAEFGSY